MSSTASMANSSFLLSLSIVPTNLFRRPCGGEKDERKDAKKTRLTGEGRYVDSRLKCNGLEFGEYLGWGLEAEAFSGCVVIALSASAQVFVTEAWEDCLAGQMAPQAADGVLDPALLPGRPDIAEIGLDAEFVGQLVVEGELGAVVESDGAAQRRGDAGELGEQACHQGFGGFADLSGEQDEAAGALVDEEDRLAVRAEGHEVGLPMSGGAAIGDVGADGDRLPAGHQLSRAAAALGEAAAAGFAAR